MAQSINQSINQLQSGYSSAVARSTWNLEMLFFVEEGKLENQEKNPQSKNENQQPTQPTRGGNSRKLNPGLIGGKGGGGGALTTAPSLLPQLLGQD